MTASRADVPEKYKWDTTDLYPSDEAWKRAAADIEARIPALAEFQKTLGRSAEDLADALEAVSVVGRDFSRLSAYASMRSDEDTRVGETRGMKGRAEAMGVKIAAATAYVRPAVLELGRAKVMGFVAEDERLLPYRPVLEDVLRYAPHTLSAAEEKVAAQASMMAEAAANTHGVFTNADLPYPEIVLSSGERVRLDASGYTRHRASSMREDRDAVFKAFWSKYKEFERTLGATLDASVKTHIFDRDVHKFGSCLEAALFDSNIPVSVYRQLVSDVNANLPTLHRYLGLRRRMMGVDTLRYEDLYAPIVKRVELRFDVEQAKDLVLGSAAVLGEEYVRELKAGFERRWVDFMPTRSEERRVGERV